PVDPPPGESPPEEPAPTISGSLRCGQSTWIYENRTDADAVVHLRLTSTCEAASQFQVRNRGGDVLGSPVTVPSDGQPRDFRVTVPPGGTIFFECVGLGESSGCRYEVRVR
ncbi:MAG: hypothetical protein D6701_08885, partial [Gemmatimonadetes bacterium]